MDLIYTNPAMEDLGVLRAYRLDIAYGEDENDFELKLPASEHCCTGGSFVYIEDTEYGGKVDSIQSDTGAGEVIYTGRTWHGLLNSKVLEPDSGKDYLIISGEANTVIGALLMRAGLEELFEVSDADSGLKIDSYSMNRYIPAYDGIRKMLSTVGGKLQFVFSGGKVRISATARGEYTQAGELDSDSIAFKAQRHYNPVNHLICLGRGELAAREVVHLYADESGLISKVQSMFGIDERVAVYENSNAESTAELEAGGVDKFRELAQADAIEASLSADDEQYDIQDLISATDHVTKLTATAQIVKKIAVVENGQVTISYEVR